MDNKDKNESVNEQNIGDMDRTDNDIGESSPSSVGSGDSRQRGRSGNDFGLTERLTDILVEDGDGDLLLQNSDREDRVMQWLQALDMQVMGACRADERLKPLLKLNTSNGVAEDRLLAHLTQGGILGAANLRDCATLESMVKKQAAEERLYAAICESMATL